MCIRDRAGAAIRIIFVFAGIPRIGLSAYLWGMLASQILTVSYTHLIPSTNTYVWENAARIAFSAVVNTEVNAIFKIAGTPIL